MRKRAWCFTLNNYDGLLDWDEFQAAGATYLSYQEEVGLQNGVEHLQGFIYFNTLKSGAQVQELLPGSWHEPAKKLEQATKYTQKTESRVGGPYIFGELPAQGRRTDLQTVKASIDSGATTNQLWEEHFEKMVLYHKSFNAYKAVKLPVRDWVTINILLVGPPGRGKTQTAWCIARGLGSDIFLISEAKGSGLYFDGYQGESIVILDEMDGGRMKPTSFNGLVDRYPYKVPVHGAPNISWAPKYIIITSNYLPKYWWSNRTRTQLNQTLRRIHLTFNFCDGFANRCRREAALAAAPEAPVAEDVSSMKPPHKQPKIQNVMIDPMTFREQMARERRLRLWYATGDPKFWEEGFPY